MLVITSVIISVRALCEDSAYGIALASIGLLSIVGLNASLQINSGISGSTNCVARLASLPSLTAINTLSNLGRMLSGVGAGFSVASGVLTSFSWVVTYSYLAGISGSGNDSLRAINDTFYIPGVLVGAMLPYALSALVMSASSTGAGYVLRNAGDSAIASTLTAATFYMVILPAALLVFAPLVLGIGLGPEMLAGVLFGTISSGFVLGGLWNASGAAWGGAQYKNHTDKKVS
ncbi:hypothetical protein EON64_06900 [archaeon]|nr:MAG: hypothetical protein EON64_06900 [archaeon]